MYKKNNHVSSIQCMKSGGFIRTLFFKVNHWE